MLIVALLHPPPNKPLQRTWQCRADIARGRIAESHASSAAVQGRVTPLNADPLDGMKESEQASNKSWISTQRAANVRDFLPSDLDGAIELWSTSAGIGLNESDTRDALLRFLARNPGLSAVAMTTEGLVGAILCGHDGRRGAIHHLAVAPAYRRRGVGSDLLEFCLSRLREVDIPRCNLFLYDDNEVGRKFWERHGWQAVSRWKTWQKRL